MPGKCGLVAIAVVSAAMIAEAAPKQHTLTIVVDGVRNSAGVGGALVFKSDRGWPEDVSAAVSRKAVSAREGATTIKIGGLRPGDYGVVVLHDENENQALDRNWFGKPTEQWGMSNNPDYFLSAPSFEQDSAILSDRAVAGMKKNENRGQWVVAQRTEGRSAVGAFKPECE